jgi:glycosyltransferase involved in cell wall biosynthesis
MKNNNNPLVTIVTVVYNGEKYLEETIKSVLSQTYENIEYIIIDGASSDNTVNIIKKYEDKITYWVSEKDDGQTDALIKGFNMSQGDILYWLNYDDLLFNKNIIKIVVDTFKKYQVELVYGNDILVDKDLAILKMRDFSFHSFGKLLYYKSISQPSAFFSKKVYKELSLNKDLDFSMDLDLWLKIFKKYKIKYVNKILSKNRIHDERKMLKCKREAELEAIKLRFSYGANKNFFSFFRLIYKVLDIKNYVYSKIFKIFL